MLGRRVAITGLGVVSTCGIGKDAFWAGLHGPGITGKQWITIDDWNPDPYFANPKVARRADRVEQFAVAAAEEAFAQAGEIGVDPRRFGVIVGTGVGGLGTLEEQVQIRLEKGERRVSPFLVPMMMANASGAAISMRYGLRGPNETVCTACAAATHALGYAARTIAMGRCDAVVSGGSEAAATPSSLAGFGNMTALSTTGSSRPFDAERDGFVMGEGSAIFILEEWEHAVARGATILGEILGAGSNADAHHITAPSPGGVGAIDCMRLALDDAGLRPDQITYVNAHGTGTALNDRVETHAIHPCQRSRASAAAYSAASCGTCAIAQACSASLALPGAVPTPLATVEERFGARATSASSIASKASASITARAPCEASASRA